TTPKLTDAFGVKGLSRAHENIEAAVRRVETKRRGHFGEVVDDVVGLFLGSASLALGGAFDVDAVFVGAGEKKCLDSLLSSLSRDRVRHDHRVEMTEVRQ